ncbi:MAG: MFS transporter [Lachnospiraceae bacterium]
MKRMQNRYCILIMATIVNFVHGNPYIWTVFQPYVKAEYGLDVAASSQPFMIIVGIFAFGNLLGGILQHKIGTRATILGGSGLMCVGFLMAAMAPVNAPWIISIGYGVLGGLGSGCAFSLLVAAPQAWFPDKRGLVTGITIGVVGISGVVMNPLCDYLLGLYGFRTTMLLVTGIYAILSFSGGWFVIAPSDVKERIVLKEETSFVSKNYTTKEMLHTRTFYLISISMALAVPAYVLVNPLMKSLGMERGLTSSVALSGVLIASFANIVGRFTAPWISDRCGRKQVVFGLYIITMFAILGISIAEGPLFVVLISCVSFTYGGFVSVYPVLTADYFGIKYQGANFGAIMLGYGVVSILCPYMVKITEATSWGLNLAFLIAGGVCVMGMIVTGFIPRILQQETTK